MSARDPKTSRHNIGDRISTASKAAIRSMLEWRNRWIVLAVLALSGFILGFVGLTKLADAQHGDTSLLTIAYLDIALASFSSGNAALGESVPWEYQVARYLLPIVVIYGAFAGLSALFRDRFQQLRLPLLRGHVVIAGLGEMGLTFAEAMRLDGTRVVAIELDGSNPNVVIARNSGIVVVVGDAREPSVLVSAGVRRARHLVVTADDATNIDVVVAAQELSRRRRGDVLDCLAHCSDSEICTWLKIYAIEQRRASEFRVEFFNFHDQAARLVCRVEPPTADCIVVIGSGPLANQVLIQCPVAEVASREQVSLTLVDPAADERIAWLVARQPALARAADLRPVTMPIDPSLLPGAGLLPRPGEGTAIVYACHEDDEVNVAIALALKAQARQGGSRIVVCSGRGDGFETLLAGSPGLADSIGVVSTVRDTCTRAFVLGGIYELLGKAIHDAYVEARRHEGEPPAPDRTGALEAWADLPESLRASNRAQAAHIGSKLGAIGCGLVPFDGSTSVPFTFADEEIEYLAEMEHERWVSERVDAGWRPGAHDVVRKTTPYLVDWDALPEGIRDRDRETVIGLPDRVHEAGFAIVRLAGPWSGESAVEPSPRLPAGARRHL